VDPTAYNEYTQELTDRLEPDPRVLALIALGSMAEADLRDEYSDHDFWLVVAAGTESHFLSDLSWLPRIAAEPLAVIRFGNRGASILHSDRHVTEFAVLTEGSLEDQPTDRYAILLDRLGLEHMLPTLVANARARRAATDHWPDAVGNLALVVWTGVARHHRGELLASQKYLRYHAVQCILNIAQAADLLSDAATNFLDPWRRLERINPRLASELLASFEQPALTAARTLLDVADAQLRPHTVDQAWAAIDTVRQWLDAAEAS
jgi:hypothetical protein